MGDKIRFGKDDINDEYVPTDSEDEYTEREKSLLAKAFRKPTKNVDSEDEVLGFSESDSDKEDPNNAESDIDDGDDELPDSRAWGKSRSVFHSTDYVDKDYGGFTGREEEVAEREEIEARALQERLAKQLDEADFSLDFFSKKQESDSEEDDVETVVKTDLSGLSKRQKLQLFQKESPEFNGLISDFKERLVHLQEFLEPLMELKRNGTLPDCPAIQFVDTQYHLVLNYCVNVSFYLVLKSKRISVQNHPVIKRLYQYRQLLTQLQPTYDEVMLPQIKKILDLLAKGELSVVSTSIENRDKKIPKKKTKKLNLLSFKKSVENIEDEKMESSDSESGEEDIEQQNDKIVPNSSESDDNEQSMEVEEAQNDDEGDGKRRITYQIAKNKGLTPHRKKEQRNPRVKHRNKFRKANIRRKGAVREVRKETTRYGGELSGIKVNVKKSVKIS